MQSAIYLKKLDDFATSDAVHCLVCKIMLGKQRKMLIRERDDNRFKLQV